MNSPIKKQLPIFLILFLMIVLIAVPAFSAASEHAIEQPIQSETSQQSFDLNNNHNNTPPTPPPRPPGNITIPPPNQTIEVPGNGSSVTINPGESIELVTPTNISLVLITNESLNLSITVLEENPAGVALPEGLVNIGVYLEIEANSTDVDVNASISIPFDPAALEDLGANASTGQVVFYNESSGQWEPALASVVNLTAGVITGYTDHFSTWTAAFETEQAPPPPPSGPPETVPIPNGTPVNVNPGQAVNLTTPSGISIVLTVGEAVEITVTELPSNPKAPLPENVRSFNLFLEIETNASVDLNATISIPIALSTLRTQGITNYSRLTLTYFDDAAGEWVTVPSVVVTVTDQVLVQANVTHFSVWSAVFVESGDEDGTATQPVPSLTVLEFLMAIVGLGALVRIYKTHSYRRKTGNS